MQKSSTSTGSTPPETPDTRPSFGRRLLAFLAYGSGRSLTSSPPFQPRSPFLDLADAMTRIQEPEWSARLRAQEALQEGARARSEQPAKDEARRALESADPFLAGYAYMGDTRKPPLGPCPSFLDLAVTARYFAKRYTRDMGESAARALAWRDNLEWRRRANEWEGEYIKLQTRNLELSNKAHASENRADILNAAIQYACSMSVDWHATEFLNRWNEGDEEADNDLREWINGPGRELLGEAVARRVGLPPVPPAVGRERPEPAPVQPARPLHDFSRDFASENTARPIPVHPEAVNFSPGAFVLGGVKVGYGVTCLELGGQRSPVTVSVGAFRPRFTQRAAQRDVCTNRVTDATTGREACNKWPLFGTSGTFCKGCPAMDSLRPHG